MLMLHNTAKFNMMVATILLASAICCSCTRTIYQDRDVYHHDSVYVTALAVDTIIQRDSIHTVERGDTIRTVIYKYIYKVKERIDTLYISKTDTMTIVETKVEEKTVRKKDWLSIIGAIVVGAIVGIIIGKIKE